MNGMNNINGNGIYNPYTQYNNSINQTNYIPNNYQAMNNINPAPMGSQTQIFIPSNNVGPQLSSNGNPIILANTHLPRSYYDDINDNLELITLNMINDLKVLIKNQKAVKVAQFDTTEFINLKDTVREQFLDIKDIRDNQKNKLIEDFANSKKEIQKYLEEKLLPGQNLLSQFVDDLKRDKKKFEENINICQENLEEEHENAKELLMASSNYYIRTAAQKVFRPNEPSDLEKALRYKRMYGTEEDRKAVEEALAEAKKSPLNIAIDNNPDEIEDILNRQKELDDMIKKDKERLGVVDEDLIEPKKKDVDEYDENLFSEHCQSEKERTDSDEEELRDKNISEIEQDYMDQLKGANELLERKKRQRKFKVLALAIFATRKLKVMKEDKKRSRIKEFNQTLLSVDEYLEKLLDEFMVKPKEAIAQYKTKIDLSLSNNVEKLEEFMKNITDTLIIKTTKVKFGRTISTFFKRYIFDMDLVQPCFFSLFEKKRIVYVKGGELDHDQKMFVLIMKVIVGILIYVVLYKESENNQNPVIAYNFKMIATIMYYSIIVYYCHKFPKHKKLFNNEILDDDIIREYKPDTKIIEEPFYKKVLMRYLDYKRKMNSELINIKEINSKNIVGYKPDHLTDEIEEISNMLLPFEEIQIYLQTKTNFDVMEALELWANHTIEIIESHNEIYLND